MQFGWFAVIAAPEAPWREPVAFAFDRKPAVFKELERPDRTDAAARPARALVRSFGRDNGPREGNRQRHKNRDKAPKMRLR